MVHVYEVAPVTAAILTVPVEFTVLRFVKVNNPGCAGAPVTVIERKLLWHPLKAFARTLIVPELKLAGKVTEMLLVFDDPVAPAGNVHV